MMNVSTKYSEIEYPEDQSGEYQYPQKLADYLCLHYFKKKGRLLDIGCGQGFYLTAFRRNGLQCYGTDNEHKYRCDFERQKLPFLTASFDYVFSKSTLEHVANWRHLLAETRRVLAFGGKAVYLVPDWNSQKWKFFDDPTHVKPYTLKSLTMAFQLAGFRDVKVDYFNLHRFKVNTVKAWLLYCREKMLLCYGVK